MEWGSGQQTTYLDGDGNVLGYKDTWSDDWDDDGNVDSEVFPIWTRTGTILRWWN